MTERATCFCRSGRWPSRTTSKSTLAPGTPFSGRGGIPPILESNAKAETVATAPAFREAFKTRRCLVPADAFYEWQKIDAKTKQPFAIGMKDGSPYAFAGLWDRWRDPSTKEPLETLTVITTDRTSSSSRCTTGCR